MNKPIYVLNKLSRKCGKRIICNIDHLEICRGEILGIIGPSGSGKSTLLRLLDLLEPITSGALIFDGIELNSASKVPVMLRRRTAMLFQTPALLSTSVLNNVSYGLKIRGLRHAKEIAIQLLNDLGMSSLANETAYNLSHGEAQRVALARVLAIRPDVLLLDEPTASLDPYNVSLIEKMVIDTNRDDKTTIVLVTHNLNQAKRMSNRAAVMLNGNIIEINKTAQLFANPRDPRTRSFMDGQLV